MRRTRRYNVTRKRRDVLFTARRARSPKRMLRHIHTRNIAQPMRAAAFDAYFELHRLKK